MWLNFDPQAGHEQSGYRPAVILSPSIYNRKTGLAICCPMTTQIKNYPFEVAVAGDTPSVVLTDQIKSLDWRNRRARPKREALSVRVGGGAGKGSSVNRVRLAARHEAGANSPGIEGCERMDTWTAVLPLVGVLGWLGPLCSIGSLDQQTTENSFNYSKPSRTSIT